MKECRILNLKMGGACNLHCPHCHSSKSSFKLNDKIFPWIRKQGYSRITLSGGEPLMYFDLIKRVVSENCAPCYRIVTNGTLLTTEIVNFLNSHNIEVNVSYDGELGVRDNSIEPDWNLISKIKNVGFSVCCYPGNMDFGKIAQDIENKKSQKKLIYFKTIGCLHNVEFPHQTEDAANDSVTSKDVVAYTDQVKLQLSYLFDEYLKGIPLKDIFLLNKAINKWWTVKKYHGVKCCNELTHTLTIDGRFMLCGYGHTFVGNIEDGMNFEKINDCLPDRCKKCEIFDICKNTCIANVTTHECMVSKIMYRYLNDTINKLKIRNRILAELDL